MQSLVVPFILQESGQRVLDRRVDAESKKLVHLSDFSGNLRWRHTVAYFPSGGMESFSERINRYASFPQARVFQYTLMYFFIKDDVLIHLVA